MRHELVTIPQISPQATRFLKKKKKIPADMQSLQA